MAKWVISEDAWHCVWKELIVNRKGLKTFLERPHTEEEYNFSAERLIVKYSSEEWNTKATATQVVELLTWHRGLMQTELDEVSTGTRVLTDKDFLGPKERMKRKMKKLKQETAKADARHLARRHLEEKKDYSEYFEAFNKALHKRRRELNKEESLERGEMLKRRLSKRLK